MDTSVVVSAPESRALSEGLGGPESGSSDSNEALASLLATATIALDTDRRAAKSCIQRAAALLGIDLSLARAAAAERSCRRGGLPLWQAKRIASYIEGKLDSRIRASELAGVVELSTSHFCRAFHKTFGESPRAHIMRRRIRRAQELMLASPIPLSRVALECGMSDQAHLCHVFRRIVGMSPSAWRRQFCGSTAREGSLGGEIAFRAAR